MRNLETIFLLQKSLEPHYDLDMAIEAITDGNDGVAYEHLLRLIHDELSQISNENFPQTFLRFCSLANAKGYEEIKKDIQDGRITLSNPFKFNDPMDPILKVWLDLQKKESWNQQEKHFFKMAKNALKNLRICCMADAMTNEKNLPLMWSHYADSHKGIAIKYKITRECIEHYNDEEHVLRLCPVAYRSEKPICNVITIDNALLAKGACWEYEAEHRLLYFTMNKNDLIVGDDKEKCSDFISLKGFEIEAIYLGAMISGKKETEIKRLAALNEIPIYKMKYNKNDITLLIEEVIS